MIRAGMHPPCQLKACAAKVSTLFRWTIDTPAWCTFPRTIEEDSPNEHNCAQMNHMPILSPEELAQALGKRIRARRLLANVSQAALADKAGISRRALVQLESGQGSTVHTLISTLKALGLEQQLDLLAPVPTVSPMAMLKAKRLRSRAT
ncbi:helix-turn-helix domain-containing protein [Stenotrophomonas maltophilia]|uniref:helix-turn-helix domain-containing protein n=1 Tax=Stenotrophomonas maltophilia TaxID=40324 RepID=UPI00290571D5|nr:helix-turn-helix transcriptional regulator [Stenotrophomonas maltophilia]